MTSEQRFKRYAGVPSGPVALEGDIPGGSKKVRQFDLLYLKSERAITLK
jgi:hypothetical protein